MAKNNDNDIDLEIGINAEKAYKDIPKVAKNLQRKATQAEVNEKRKATREANKKIAAEQQKAAVDTAKKTRQSFCSYR